MQEGGLAQPEICELATEDVEAGGRDAGGRDAGGRGAGGRGAGGRDAGSRGAGGHDARRREAGGARALLDELGFDERMKVSRAVVIAAPRLDEHTLLGSLPFEVATRARQAGVPCYAVTGENVLALFDARILDLQVVIEARSERSLRGAGRRLAEIL